MKWRDFRRASNLIFSSKILPWKTIRHQTMLGNCNWFYWLIFNAAGSSITRTTCMRRGRCQQNDVKPRRFRWLDHTKDELHRVLPWRSIEWKGRATRWDSLSRAINFGSDGLFRPDRAYLFRLNEAGTGRLGREPPPRSAWLRVEPAAVAKSCRLV